MPQLFFDFGNADAKWYDGHQHYGHFRHAIAELRESQWREAVKRGKQPPEGFIAINGRYFVVGDKARRHQIKDKPRGAARYVNDYYGVALCFAISECFDAGTRVINLRASHAPQDIRYSENIVNSCIGGWNFVTSKGDYSVDIKSVETYDEPLGGFNHAVLHKNGKPVRTNPYRDKTVLVIDVGGHTVDVVAVDPGGKIDESSLGSVRTGTLDVMRDFEAELRSRYSSDFMDVGDINEDRIEDAMLNGFYRFGNRKLKCKDLGEQAIQVLVNDIVDVIRANGTVANFDVALLTGGGSALIVDALRKSENRIDFEMVESKREDMRYANVFGGAKLFAMLEWLGVL